MEDCPDNKRKRVDNDSHPNSPESKRFLAHTAESALLRIDSDESQFNSPEAQQIQDDLLNILEDLDVVTTTDLDSAIQRLDSVIRGFEEEILVPSLAPVFHDLTSNPGESQPELGYLLRASDDELGLPPKISFGEEARIDAVDFETDSLDAVGLDGILGFENEIRPYDSFEFGMGVDWARNLNDNSCEFVALGGLFDHSDISEFSWRPESLPAL